MRAITFITLLLILVVSSASIAAPNKKDRTTGKEADTESPVLVVPENITAEAVSSEGATVTFKVSATDNTRKGLTTNCTPASGNLFPLSQTTVQCIARDRAGNESFDSFIVSIVDTTIPILSLPANITGNTTSELGDNISFSVNATDSVDGSITVNCSAASGSVFPIGQSTVVCDAADRNGNSASGSFYITLTQTTASDTTAPVLSLPGDITTEAIAASGASVSYPVSATDEVDGAVAPICSHTSGSTYALGQTSVTCNASDSQGNSVTGSFTVSVVDTTAPQLALPANLTVDATLSTGIVVDYLVSAIDSVDQSVDVICTPLSGSVFSVGDSAVSCQAIDSNGNIASGNFLVSVTIPVATTTSVKLTWSIPTSRENGDPLFVAELAGYEIYVVAETSGQDQMFPVNDPLATSKTIMNLTADTYYFSISSIDSDGLRSAPSDLISTVIQ